MADGAAPLMLTCRYQVRGSRRTWRAHALLPVRERTLDSTLEPQPQKAFISRHALVSQQRQPCRLESEGEALPPPAKERSAEHTLVQVTDRSSQIDGRRSADGGRFDDPNTSPPSPDHWGAWAGDGLPGSGRCQASAAGQSRVVAGTWAKEQPPCSICARRTAHRKVSAIFWSVLRKGSARRPRARSE